MISKPLGSEEILKLFTDVPPVHVQVGPLSISVQADASRGQAVVGATLLGTLLAKQLLCFLEPVLTLDIALADSTAKGTLTLNLQGTQGYASVTADVIATQAATAYPLRGMVCDWPATIEPVVGEYRVMLTSELSTLTTVRGAAANIAGFAFYAGSTLMTQTEATQFAPLQIFPDAIESGDIKILPAAQVSLFIPTTISTGWLWLQATFSSSTTPPTQVSSSVANWQLPGA
ncbi:hypothetical protein BLL37_31170 [Pseudomonas azotoformans]|uniref:Uncharacterized protein n=1 Tax=Pseudomonas azotoformans TaxID=47878 RepID=A0A1V2J310_PSEAZ|nr:hypothetical protein BFL39_24465 [Pseudomonas azotoformans]ONH39822.1 hypothetical protein BLL37_31170 [Pseudomonas azotoformans]